MSVLLLLALLAQQPSHHDAVNKRGDQAMGFSHEKTAHHFLLLKDGGVIDAAVNDAKDAASREQIRVHFGHIAKAFAAGDFQLPMLIHDQDPPGVEAMKRHAADIQYRYVKTPRGAHVRIRTQNPEALRAVHEFLRFQIQDHKTGDPLSLGVTPHGHPAPRRDTR